MSASKLILYVAYFSLALFPIAAGLLHRSEVGAIDTAIPQRAQSPTQQGIAGERLDRDLVSVPDGVPAAVVLTRRTILFKTYRSLD